jgi:hypothetical protein
MLVPERPWKITKTMADKIAGNKDAFACPDLAHLLPHLLYESQQSPHFISPEKETFQQAEELFKQLLSNKFKPLHKIWAKDLGFMCKGLKPPGGIGSSYENQKKKGQVKDSFCLI